jgi:hypothetical protein
MSQSDNERRRRRSDDPITALHYQLSAVRADMGLSAVVLVDDRGCLVAGAGAWPVCEELAAYAPLLSDPQLPRSTSVSSRLAELGGEAHVETLVIDGAPALLCGHGGSSAARQRLERAAAGCQRILARAA